MYTQTAQVKLTLPSQLNALLASKAGRFGLPTASYVRHLILNDVSDMDLPEFIPSAKTEKAYLDSKKDELAGNIHYVKKTKDYFAKL